MNRTPEQIELYRLEKRLSRLFNKACADYALIEDGDHILVGISGGKDSLTLAQLLSQRAKIYVPHFKVSALHIRAQERYYTSDIHYLHQFCEEAGIPLLVRDIDIGEARDGKDPCFLCSWYRRKMLFEVAHELGCNKIALGHHKDDILRTALMNLTFQGRFEGIAPKLSLDKMPITIIRPLCLITEHDIGQLATLKHYQQQLTQCPFEKETNRTYINQVIQAMLALNPHAMDSLWGAIEKTL